MEVAFHQLPAVVWNVHLFVCCEGEIGGKVCSFRGHWREDRKVHEESEDAFESVQAGEEKAVD